jgi:hypothetical protein
MYIHVALDAAPPTARLAERDDFGSFAVVVDGTEDRLVEVVDALAGLGSVDADGQHAMLDIEAVRRLADADDTWVDGYRKMIDYARTHGWTDDGRVRAHLEWRTK